MAKTYKKNYRKKTYKKKYKKQSLAVKAYKMVRSIKRGIERKYINTTWSETKSATNGWQLYNLTECTEGTGPTQRIGDQITVSSIRLNAQLETQGSSPTPQSVRCIIFQTLQQVPDTDPTIGSILQNTSYINSPYAYPNYKRYVKVLFDRIYNLGPFNANNSYSTVTGSYNTAFNKPHFMNLNIRPKYKNIRYNGSTATDEQKYQVYMFIGFLSTNDVNILLQNQMAFTDL